ncbi:(deoxy)nucleoside triphosphate pyrophosphohydrolase [Alteraurantiacibacter palmitatis]|uniref:8-oxo-dGTP diphosphatase n=1 Tax=Alteraurantiacibacter palmitatis TaxID=2054628 RepID=A0ABV7E3F0_9SPHN
MEENPTWIPVVALALRDASARVLLQQRLPHKHHGGLWEFPGGKVESAENPRFALVREIAEELGIRIETTKLSPLFLADEAGVEAGPAGVVLLLYTCREWRGAIAGRDGQQWGWFTLDEAAGLPLAPMDGDLLSRLKILDAVAGQ